MESPSTPHSHQNAGENIAFSVNNVTNDGVNIMSSNADFVPVIDYIDLDHYEQNKEFAWVKITMLCKQLQSKSTVRSGDSRLRNQIDVLRRIKGYSINIEDETVWKYIFEQYSHVTQKFSDVSIAIAIISLICVNL